MTTTLILVAKKIFFIFHETGFQDDLYPRVYLLIYCGAWDNLELLILLDYNTTMLSLYSSRDQTQDFVPARLSSPN